VLDVEGQLSPPAQAVQEAAHGVNALPLERAEDDALGAEALARLQAHADAGIAVVDLLAQALLPHRQEGHRHLALRALGLAPDVAAAAEVAHDVVLLVHQQELLPVAHRLPVPLRGRAPGVLNFEVGLAEKPAQPWLVGREHEEGVVHAHVEAPGLRQLALDPPYVPRREAQKATRTP
jgi:hypothetical protein